MLGEGRSRVNPGKYETTYEGFQQEDIARICLIVPDCLMGNPAA